MELKNKLTNGMVFKSYRALCKHMNWESTGGNTRMANIKKLNAICTYHKQIKAAQGLVEISHKPGLGVELYPEAMEKYTVNSFTVE